jgi:DNA-binding transcriptional regulator GbsR (MarR family)
VKVVAQVTETQPNVEREHLLSWVERVAMFCAEQYGLPPITGRILGWLMICDPPEQSAGEIAEAIGASRASLTTNMRLLTATELVHRRTRPGERTTYYRVDDDAWEKIVRRKFASLASFREIARDGMDLVGTDSARGARLRAAHEIYGWLEELLSNAAEPPPSRRRNE